MSRRDVHLRSVLHHVPGQDLGEIICSGVEVAEHGAAPSPVHQVYGVNVDLRKKERHSSSQAEGVRAEVCLSETNFGSGCADYGAYGGGDIVAVDDVLVPVEIDCLKGFFSGIFFGVGEPLGDVGHPLCTLGHRRCGHA